MYKVIVIRTTPQGNTYRQLLDFAQKHCKLFSLKWIEGGPHNIIRTPINLKLRPFLLREDCVQEWRDFKTFKSFYSLTPESAEPLATAESLFLWNTPGWPSDLALYVEDGKCWLFSVTQNREAYVYVDAMSIDLVRDQVPGLDLELQKPVLAIDGKDFSTLEEFYNQVSEKLIPGAYWGHNLDAFNDILYGGFGTPVYGFVLVWRNANLSRERLGYSETIRQLEIRKRKCHPSHIPRIDQDLQRARKGEGPTVFDWLVEIIQSHETIDLVLE